MTESQPPLMLVGAARSGTHLLGTSLAEVCGFEYLGELNELWKKHLPVTGHDAAPVSLIDGSVVRRTREEFGRRLQGASSRVVDKTPANVFRLPLIDRVFPDAQYVHIVRDGRSVALSARRKYGSKERIGKVTKSGGSEVSPAGRLRRVAAIARRKWREGLTWRRLAGDWSRYVGAGLTLLGLRDEGMWGARFPGWEDCWKTYSRLEFAILQWQESIQRSMNFFSSKPDLDVVQLKYEDLIAEPAEVLNRIVVELDLPVRVEPESLTGRFRSERTDWRALLSDEEKEQVRTLAEETLTRLGYPAT